MSQKWMSDDDFFAFDDDFDDEGNNVSGAGNNNQTTNTITITRDDVDKNAQFSCNISIDETKLPSDETQQS